MIATELSKLAHELQMGEPCHDSSFCCYLKEERRHAEQVCGLLEKQCEGNIGDCKHNAAPGPLVPWNITAETTDEVSSLQQPGIAPGSLKNPPLAGLADDELKVTWDGQM